PSPIFSSSVYWPSLHASRTCCCSPKMTRDASVETATAPRHQSVVQIACWSAGTLVTWDLYQTTLVATGKLAATRPRRNVRRAELGTNTARSTRPNVTRRRVRAYGSPGTSPGYELKKLSDIMRVASVMEPPSMTRRTLSDRRPLRHSSHWRR